MTISYWEIASYVIAILIGVFGSYFLIFKNKLAQLKKVIDVVASAVEDGEVTPEEVEAIVTAIRELFDV